MSQQYSFRLNEPLQTQTHTTDAPIEDRLTEIILPNLPTATDNLLMPIIAKLSQPSERWLTWVTSEMPNKRRLLANGINLEHLRIVLIKPDNDYSLIENLLELGNSHTVIAEINRLDDLQRFDMEQAAAMGNTNAIVISQKVFI